MVTSRARATLRASVVGLMVAFAPAMASAQPDADMADTADTAAAADAFAAGNAASDAGDYETAASHYARAVALEDSDRYQLNYALALEALGRYAEAEHVARRVDRDPILRDAARELIVRVSSGSVGETSEGRASGVESDETTQTTEAATQRVELSPVVAATTVSLAPAPPPARHRSVAVLDGRAGAGREGLEAHEHEDGTPLVREWWFWTAVGVVATAASVTTAAVLVSNADGPTYTMSSVGIIDVGR